MGAQDAVNISWLREWGNVTETRDWVDYISGTDIPWYLK